jgi:prevent-host-death family protein
MNVGIRELKAHLSEYVDRAARGEVICVTDRGRARAILAPITDDSRVDEGAKEGWIRPGSGAPPRVVARHPGCTTVAAVLDDDRADR